MNDQSRPGIFRAIWPPEPTSNAPIGNRLHRLPSRGPAHLLLLLAATGLVLTLLPAAVLAAMSLHAPLPAIVTGLVAAAMLTLLLRAWVRGTYVNDQGYLVRRMLASQRGRWVDIRAVTRERGRLVLLRADNRNVTTQVGTGTLDTLLRAEAADMAMLRLQDLWAAGRISTS